MACVLEEEVEEAFYKVDKKGKGKGRKKIKGKSHELREIKNEKKGINMYYCFRLLRSPARRAAISRAAKKKRYQLTGLYNSDVYFKLFPPPPVFFTLLARGGAPPPPFASPHLCQFLRRSKLPHF